MEEQGMTQVGIKAVCMWVRPSLTKPFIESGLKFLETSEEAKRIINLLIELFALPDANIKS
jgi:hypothetical protein